MAAYLRTEGAEARLEEFDAGTPTARDAARAVGCELAQIVKSLVLACDGRFIVALVPGDRRADTRKLAAALGCQRVTVADADAVRAATGFDPGAVAPFPLPRVDRVVIERTLLSRDVVWIGAGSPRHMAGLAPVELVRLARATPMDAVQDGA